MQLVFKKIYSFSELCLAIMPFNIRYNKYQTNSKKRTIAAELNYPLFGDSTVVIIIINAAVYYYKDKKILY